MSIRETTITARFSTMMISGKPTGRPRSISGFSMIELLIVIVVIGIMASVAVHSMIPSLKDARRIETEREMEMLAAAIVGDPDLTQGNVRCDFGYVGDVGAFPADLQDLYQNPGGYSTWGGPYIVSGYSEDVDGFKTDGWGKAYSYNGTSISSSGGGSTITKKIASATGDYLLNSFRGSIVDSDNMQPGVNYTDSINVIVTAPNGSGSVLSKTCQPDASGSFRFDSLPVGKHPLNIVYKPASDTLHRFVTVLPRHRSTRLYAFAEDYFTAAGGSPEISFVPDSDSLWEGDCYKLKFWVENNSGTPIDVNSVTVTWSSPTAYYKVVTWDGTTVRNSTPSAASGELTSFTAMQTLANGARVQMTIEEFTPDAGGGGLPVNMLNTDFEVLFSDGSTINFTADLCN